MEATVAPETYESEILDHLGLVSGMYDELQIGDRIDEHIAQDFGEREVSIGQSAEGYGSQWFRVCPAVSLSDAAVLRLKAY